MTVPTAGHGGSSDEAMAQGVRTLCLGPSPSLSCGKEEETGSEGGGAAPQGPPGQGAAWRDPQAPHGGTNPALAAAEPAHKERNAGPGCKHTLPHPPRAQRPCRAKSIPASSEHPAEGAQPCSEAGKHRASVLPAWIDGPPAPVTRDAQHGALKGHREEEEGRSRDP